MKQWVFHDLIWSSNGFKTVKIVENIFEDKEREPHVVEMVVECTLWQLVYGVDSGAWCEMQIDLTAR